MKRSAAVPAAVVGASRPHRRGQDALATASKMPALPECQPSFFTTAKLSSNIRTASSTSAFEMFSGGDMRMTLP